MRFLLLFFIPILCGIPMYTNALGIDESILITVLILLILITCTVILKVEVSKNLFWLWVLPMTSLVYAQDRYLSSKYYLLYAVYICLYFVFKRYNKPIIVYKVIVWYSVVLMLYVIFQNTEVFPYLLTQPIDEGMRNLLLSGRQFATFQLPNAYAAFSIIGIFLSLYIHKKEHRFIYVLLAVLNIAMLVLTKTFIAFALMIGYVVLLMLYRRRYKHLLIITTVVVVLSVLFLSLRAYTSVERSLYDRYYNYSAAFAMYADFPLLGVGENNFDLHYPKYQQKNANVIHNAHSYFLQSLADHGVFGVLMSILFVLTLMRLKNSPLFPMFIVLGLYFLFDLMYYFPSIAGLYWVLYAMNEPDEGITISKRVYAWILIVVYVGVLAWYHYNPPQRYLKRLVDEQKRDYDKGLYYSAWLKTVEFEEYRYK